MADVRKIVFSRETVFSELGRSGERPVVRATAIAVIANPFAGRVVEDLSPLFRIGGELGERLMAELAQLLGASAVSYGKGAIVGVGGEMEHGGACIHPMLGKPMRGAIGGGKASMPLDQPGAITGDELAAIAAWADAHDAAHPAAK